ncbi:MAG: hypothetical protein ACE5LU_18400 [Anaerolineae bacterium]
MTHFVGRQRELAEWKVHYAFFARAGFTEAARATAKEHGFSLVTLEQLDRTLRTAGD